MDLVDARLASLLASTLLIGCSDDTVASASAGADTGGSTGLIEIGSEESTVAGTTEAADTSGSDSSGGGTTTTGGSSGSSTGTAVCGDETIQDDEECDAGADNGDDQNCLADCTINPVQRVTAGDDAIELVDAVQSSLDPLIGEASWCATPDEDTNGDGADKFELFFSPTAKDPRAVGAYNFGPITVADIDRVVFHTNKPDTQDGTDFYLVLYTEADGVNDAADWYGDRLHALPHLSNQLDAPASEWNRWSTEAGTNELTFYDTAHTQGGFPNQPSFADVLSNPFDWSAWLESADATAIDYGSEQVRYLSLQTGSGASTTFNGCVDGIEIHLTDGRSGFVDLD